MNDDPLFRELIEKIEKLNQYPNWLSVRQCAEYLGLSDSTIRKMISAGSIPFQRIPTTEGGAIRFNRRQIDFWLLSGQTRPKARTRQTFEALL